MQRIFVLTIVIFFSVFGCKYSTCGTKMECISKEKAVSIANRQLANERFEVVNKSIVVDENYPFNTDEQFNKANPSIQERLKDRSYWSVHYTQRNHSMLGGEAWVFVDKMTGEIILRLYLK